MKLRIRAFAAAIASALALARSAEAHFSTFDGIYYDVHGTATTSIGPLGELVVSGIGSSGEDGISLIVPDGTRGMIFDHEWGERVGLGITTRRVIGVLGRQGPAEIEVLRVTLAVTDDGNVEVTSEVPQGGADGVLLDVLSVNGENYREYLAAAIAIHLEVVTTTAATRRVDLARPRAATPTHEGSLFAIGEQGVRIVQESPTLQYIELRFDEPVRVRTPAQPDGVVGDAIRLARTTGAPIAFLTRVKLTGIETPGAGEGSFAIKDEGVKVHDGFAHASGDALFDSDGIGGVRVMNLGVSGADGVTIEGDTPDGQVSVFGFTPVEIHAPPAAWMDLSATGVVDGAPPAMIGVVRVTWPGDGVDLTPDFSPLGASSWSATVLNDGVVVAELAGMMGRVSCPLTARTFAWQQLEGPFRFSVRTRDGIARTFAFGPATYVGDELQIEPELPPGPGVMAADYFLKLDVRCAGLAELDIEDVIALPQGGGVTSVPEPGRLQPIALKAPWPNPSSSAVAVEFALARVAPVRASVVDLAGRWVRSLADRSFTPGSHRISWDGRDDAGRASSPGVYYVRIEAAGVARSVAVVRMR
jgi:hypothetical protein